MLLSDFFAAAQPTRFNVSQMPTSLHYATIMLKKTPPQPTTTQKPKNKTNQKQSPSRLGYPRKPSTTTKEIKKLNK
jgi:hypothetical protein